MTGASVGVLLSAAVTLSCSNPDLHVEGRVLLRGSPAKPWCTLELRDATDPRRSAGVVGVQASERFSVRFAEGREKIISDDSTPLVVVVLCEGYAPGRRAVGHDPMRRGIDLGMVVVDPKRD